MKIKIFKNQYTFKPSLIPLIAFIVALSILIGLSSWQFKRLAWKKNLIEARVSMFESDPKPLNDLKNPSEMEFQRISVRGKLFNEFEFFMPALSKNGNNGFHILIPLKIDDNQYIIYNSGWVPLQKKLKEQREKNIIIEEKIFSAVIRIPGRKGYFQPENDPVKNFWFFVEPELMEKELDFKLEKSFYLEASDNGPNGFPLGNQTRIYLRNNHFQYALTWLFIGFGLIGVFISANLKKN
tara:strand:+ start:1849 stop:2565 length:717 start_codon:yes stop_codon:yes gene_type:complete